MIFSLTLLLRKQLKQSDVTRHSGIGWHLVAIFNRKDYLRDFDNTENQNAKKTLAKKSWYKRSNYYVLSIPVLTHCDYLSGYRDE